VKEVLLEGYAHLLPQQVPSQYADAAAWWIEADITRWKDDEINLANGWGEKMLREKSMVSQDWIMHISGKASRL
jgi:hypothetical protein